MNTLPPWMKGSQGARGERRRALRPLQRLGAQPPHRQDAVLPAVAPRQNGEAEDVDQKALAALETEVAAAAKAADAEEEDDDEEEAEAEASPAAAPPTAAAPASKRQRVVAPPPPRSALAINAKVSARYDASGKRHDGTITNINENGTFKSFDDGDFDEKVAPKHIRLSEPVQRTTVFYLALAKSTQIHVAAPKSRRGARGTRRW